MITLKNIIFEYPGKRALKDVSFTIKPGSITALVGPNGSGKTTLMRCMAALDVPFSGSIEVNGIDALEHPRDIHQHIGYLSDFFGVYKDLTVRQCLTYIASIHGIPETDIPQKIALAAKRLAITDYMDSDAGSLSRGLRQRLGIAQALIHEPHILLLDEPASGLDPESRINLSKLFLSLKAEGVTLVVSSHILAELEDYCTDMLLLRDGQIIEHCVAAKTSQAEQTGVIDIILGEQAEPYIPIISAIAGISQVSAENKTLKCTFSLEEKALHDLLAQLIAQGLPIWSFTPYQKRLQDIYMDYAQGEK